MDETNGSWFPRERQNSNPFHFTSGHEVSRSSSATNIYGNSSFTAFPEKAETKFSPKPGKRTRKLSLFSFHFNSKSNSEERGKVRRSSQPAFNQPSPTTLSPDPDVWMASLKPTGSQNSLDSSPSSSRKCSSVLGPIERENIAIHDIIQETLKLQFENVTEYNRDACDRLGKNVCQLVKRRVEAMKEATRQRCKIVSVVYVGAVRDHGIQVASQALLEADKDNFTVASYRNGKVFTVGGIMVIPLEK